MTELKQMFKAQVNSMSTAITNNISPTDTNITVLDGAILPDAPSLLVIGSGTNAETVKLTAKNIDILTIERGFQGSAKGWNVGTTIARNFTAYDHDAFLDNIEKLKTKQLELETLPEDLSTHIESEMPHLFTNKKTNKTYRYGYQINVDGNPQIICEEVV